jgi:hypothetical protein
MDEEQAIKDGEHPSCVSSIQNCYDIRILEGEETFASELQNEPIRINKHTGETNKANLEQLKKSIITIPRGIVPIDQTRLVMYIDVHKRLFYWACVSKNLMTKKRHLVDYNTWPEQSSRRFTLENSKRTIPQMFPGLGTRVMAERAMGKFLNKVVAMRWKNQSGQRVNLDEIRVDANWGGTTDNIRNAIRNHPGHEKMWGCHGIGRNEKQTGLDEWALKPGEDRGPGFITSKVNDHGVQQLNIDTNIWKTETHIALTTPNEENGSLSVFDGDDLTHELFFEHLLVEVWQCPKGGQNHWFDCITGALVDDDKSPPTGPTGNSFKLNF